MNFAASARERERERESMLNQGLMSELKRERNKERAGLG